MRFSYSSFRLPSNSQYLGKWRNMPATMSTLRRGLNYYRSHRRGFTVLMYASFFTSLAFRSLYPSRKEPAEGKERRTPKVAVDRNFLRNLIRLIRIIMPDGIFSKEFWLLSTETVFLIIRTALSLYVARLDGQITSHLVRGQGRQFAIGIVWWLLVGFPAAFTNSILQYLQRTIALRFRMRLSNYILARYLPSRSGATPVYYAMSNLDDNVRVRNADQVVTADVARFANALSNLYSNLTKPVLDVFLYTWQLSTNIGADNVFFMGLAVHLSGRALRLTAPPFGEFVAEEAALEGDFRAKHTRLIDYSEEIALYEGHKAEKRALDRSFYSLYMHICRILRKRLRYHIFEDFVIKYYWGALGLVLCSIPVFIDPSSSLVPLSKNLGPTGSRTQAFVTNRRLLLFSSDAFGRIIESYKDISMVAGYTSRVTKFITIAESLDHLEDSQVELELEHINSKSSLKEESESEEISDHRVEIGNYIEFDNVPIVSPAGEVLVKSLSFQVKPGDHLLVVGPNGCGKSSLFRLLGGLWELKGGHMVRPPQHDIFYIPQRPYLSRGTLRQQVIYPTFEADNTVSDADLAKILDVLDIGDIVEQVGGWDAEREWREDLSIGVQQKIAAARLFYHRPTFAILDEATSSMTLDVETIMYTHAKQLGISLLTVSHRASLWQYHTKILQFDGYGGYIFTDLDAGARLKLEEEKLSLDMKLRQVDDMRERLRVLLTSGGDQAEHLHSDKEAIISQDAI